MSKQPSIAATPSTITVNGITFNVDTEQGRAALEHVFEQMDAESDRLAEVSKAALRALYRAEMSITRANERRARAQLQFAQAQAGLGEADRITVAFTKAMKEAIACKRRAVAP